MSRRRYGVITLAATIVLSTWFALGAASQATASGVGPAHNVAIARGISNVQWYFSRTTCQHAPAGSTCEKAILGALNHARATLGQRRYVLPSGFRSMTAGQQLLALVNDDRALYRLPRVQSLSNRLNIGATRGARLNIDPLPVGHGWTTVASNWAGGMASPLFAYYGWMYGDGLNRDGTSNNIDCTVAHHSGCWSHRDNILRNYGRHTKLLLGVGHAKTVTGASWTQLFQAYPRS